MNDSNSNMINQIYKLLDDFLDLSREAIPKHPAIVVILMHEYFRSLYPNDPFIEERYDDDIFLNIKKCLENNIIILKSYIKLGSYNFSKHILDIPNNHNEDGIKQMNNLFGSLWEERFNEKVLDSKDVINDLFNFNKLNLSSLIKNKSVIDIGCGSGRFSSALARLGAKNVVGVDINKQGLELARNLVKQQKVNNIKFINHDILNLPFDDESFDFVFSKGVLHHTGNLNKGLDEYSRVLKKGGSGYLYLYASGGIYWNSRKKMRDVMKMIPMEFAIKVLNSIGMPSRRTIFVDSWYVPIEEYIESKYIEDYFSNKNFQSVTRLKSSRLFELDKIVLENGDWAKDMWGEGELRYHLTK